MIYVLIITAAIALLAGVFVLMPDLPPIPSAIDTSINTALDLMQQGIYLIAYLIGAPLFYATIVVLIAVFAFEPIYHLIIWVLRKIPVLGIK